MLRKQCLGRGAAAGPSIVLKLAITGGSVPLISAQYRRNRYQTLESVFSVFLYLPLFTDLNDKYPAIRFEHPSNLSKTNIGVIRIPSTEEFHISFPCNLFLVNFKIVQHL